MIEAVFPIGRIGRAIAFRIVDLVPTGSSGSETRDIGTIGKTAMDARASFALIETLRLYRHEKSGAKDQPATTLPSFITGEPKSTMPEGAGLVSEQNSESRSRVGCRR